MNVFENVTSLLGVILWPLVAAGFLFYFREPISRIIGSIGRAIERAEGGSVGVGGFRLDWGKAEEEMVSAAEKTEQGAATKSTGDGGVGSAVTKAVRGAMDRIGIGDAPPEPEPAAVITPGAGAESGPGAPAPAPAAPARSKAKSKRGKATEAAQVVEPPEPEWEPVSITPRDMKSALERARRVAPRLAGLRVLWVDDSPQQNAQERRMLRAMNVEVAAVEEHTEALDVLARGDFDIVISDMRRGEDTQAGAVFLEEIRALGFRQPVIFYIGRLDPSMGVPPFAFGITNRPDELLHYILEIAERKV